MGWLKGEHKHAMEEVSQSKLLARPSKHAHFRPSPFHTLAIARCSPGPRAMPAPRLALACPRLKQSSSNISALSMSNLSGTGDSHESI